MNPSNATPGIGAIVAGVLFVSAAISLVTGTHAHWPIVLAGIAVGLMAVRSIHR